MYNIVWLSYALISSCAWLISLIHQPLLLSFCLVLTLFVVSLLYVVQREKDNVQLSNLIIINHAKGNQSRFPRDIRSGFYHKPAFCFEPNLSFLVTQIDSMAAWTKLLVNAYYFCIEFSTLAILTRNSKWDIFSNFQTMCCMCKTSNLKYFRFWCGE